MPITVDELLKNNWATDDDHRHGTKLILSSVRLRMKAVRTLIRELLGKTRGERNESQWHNNKREIRKSRSRTAVCAAMANVLFQLLLLLSYVYFSADLSHLKSSGARRRRNPFETLLFWVLNASHYLKHQTINLKNVYGASSSHHWMDHCAFILLFLFLPCLSASLLAYVRVFVYVLRGHVVLECIYNLLYCR